MWKKKGLICNREIVSDLSWYRLNCMCPTPILIGDIIRVFVALCDGENRGRVGYLDVKASNPSVLLDYSREPVLDIGPPGRFDESGVLPTSLLIENNRLYLYYCGFQRQMTVPYTSLCGVAVSDNKGESFVRMKETPVLERVTNELFIRTGALIERTVLLDRTVYTLYYASGTTWFELQSNKLEPRYNLKKISSERLDSFLGEGEVVVDFTDDEYGITMPQLQSDNSLIFSSRTRKDGYRIVRARLENGKYVRETSPFLDVSKNGWDSEMVCFGKTITYKEHEYLFYCGNHYGIGGMGWAERDLS